jgi:dTDP-4-dehydrorhamnose 3,5-epimerase
LHVQFSKPPPNKIVSIIQGSIIALSICCNKDCMSFGELTVKRISNESSKALIIPKLQAFGYLVVEDNTLIATCIDQPYSEADEQGINPNSFTSILKYSGEIRISLKDQKWPNLNDFLRMYKNN